MRDYDVVVIGAGLGGLSAAALLVHQGRRVLVVEQSNRIGGCCSTFERDGYCFDVGASIVEVIYPIELTFEKLGTTFQQEVDLIACDPVMSVVSRDGSRITYPRSFDGMAEVIASISPDDAQRWPDFCAYMAELVEVCLAAVFTRPADTLGDMLRMIQADRRLVKYLPAFATSYENVVRRFFRHEKVLETMGYQSLYFGLPPALVPGAFAMIPYTEHLGVYYPRGGMIQIPLALQRCGERCGLQTWLNAAVERVLVREGHVQGVRLDDGTEIEAAVVVSNVNARTLYLEMIGEQHLPARVVKGLHSYQYSKAVPMIYLGLDYEPPLDAHHTTVAATPERINRYWWENVERGRLSDETLGLICWPTHSDPSLAPPDHHVLNLIPEGFYRLEGTDWDMEKPRFIERTLNDLASFALPGLTEHVTVVDCATPLDFERQLRLPEGAIYSLQQDITAMTVFRPAARSKSVRGLYLTGASTHPGGGVPTTIASGLIAAGLIEQDER